MIKKGVKLELYRAFHNASFYGALALGCLISIVHFVLEVLPKTKVIGCFVNISYPESVFNSCLALGFGSSEIYMYYFAIVLIGTIPFGVSYYTDLRYGYIKNIYTRMNRTGYLLGKYLAVFLSAGSVCVIPLILNLMLTMAVLPALIPQQGTFFFAVCGSCMMSELFYTHPFAYLFVYFMIDFIFTGLFACMALSVTRFVYNRYVVLFAPFIIFFVLQTILVYTSIPSAAPMFAMLPTQKMWQKPEIVITEMLLLFGISFSTFWFEARKQDVI